MRETEEELYEGPPNLDCLKIDQIARTVRPNFIYQILGQCCFIFEAKEVHEKRVPTILQILF